MAEMHNSSNEKMPHNPTGLILKCARWVFNRLFMYPVDVRYVNQLESGKGYIIEIDICSRVKRLVSIPKKRFGAELILDDTLSGTMDRSQQLYGERVQVFDSIGVLDAFLRGKSYGNVSSAVRCHSKASRIYLLITVEGPGSTNPSSRLQVGRVYTGVRVSIKKRVFQLAYLEIALHQISIVAGNDTTRIVDDN